MMRELRAGPLSLVYQADELRDIRINGRLVLDRLYFALRDTDWLTLPLSLEAPIVEAGPSRFSVSVAGSSATPGATFRFSLEFVGASDSLVARVRYQATEAAAINRIGFCLLYPMDFAGEPLIVLGRDGAIESAFPSSIAPWSPFTEFHGLRMEAGGANIQFDFEGDEFDLEDQRNWIDASFKAFAPPLSEPLPRRLSPKDGGEQSVTLRWSDAPGGSTMPARVTPAPIAAPSIGLGASRGPVAVSPAEAELLRALDPAWIAVTLLLDTEWEPRWRRAVAEAEAIGLGIDVSLVASDPAAVAHWGDGIPMPTAGLVRLQSYDFETHVTTTAHAEALHHLRTRVPRFSGVPIAGGARANFTELSRTRAQLPLHLLDEVVFAANPQVHAFDDESIMTTPRALAVAAADAQRLAGGRPLLVGPLTFTRTFNAVAAHPGEQPELPPDERQHEQVAADWIIAAIDASGAAAGITVYETRGDWGVLDSAGAPTPAYRALAERAARIRTGLPPNV